MGVSENGGIFPPKMDGLFIMENPYLQHGMIWGQMDGSEWKGAQLSNYNPIWFFFSHPPWLEGIDFLRFWLGSDAGKLEVRKWLGSWPWEKSTLFHSSKWSEKDAKSQKKLGRPGIVTWFLLKFNCMNFSLKNPGPKPFQVRGFDANHTATHRIHGTICIFIYLHENPSKSTIHGISTVNIPFVHTWILWVLP